MSKIDKIISFLSQVAQDADRWITVNGAHVPLEKNGEPGGAVGRKLKQAEQEKADVFGEAFTAYTGKPAEAIEHLLKEKRGHVPGAFHKQGLGDIDLPYGKTGKGGFGLAHIIERRNEQGYDGVAFIRELPRLIDEGSIEYRREYKNRAYIVHNKKEAVVRLDWDGKDKKWLVTAYFQEDAKSLSSDRRTDLNQTCVSWKATQPNLESLTTKLNLSPQVINVNTMKTHNHTLTLDAAPSGRRFDENGYLHVKGSHITKATVNPYYGHEIPGWEKAGLDPEKVYYGLRHPDELKKSLPTWSGLPLHVEHHIDSAADPQKLTRVGAVGTEIVWNDPYIDAPLVVWDDDAIDAIEDGSFRELSCAYRYEPDFTPGAWQGQDYDFIMRNIRGNHVALVEEGRAGADVLVADARPAYMKDEKFEENKHPRDEKGRFGNGSGGEQSKGGNTPSEKEISITGNELGSYRDIKELRQKAMAYYKANLQGKPAYREDIGEIRFSKKGMDETRAFSANPDKLLMFPALRSIIETGQLGKEEEPNHPRKDGIVAFIPISKTVNFKGKPTHVESLVGKDENGKLYYDLFLDNSRKKQSPNSNKRQNSSLSGDTAGISPALDLNISFASRSVNTDSAAKGNLKGAFMSRLKNWFRGARDADPAIEQKEVDLAQAIIDLHRTDPLTGEVKDIAADNDKAEELRVLVEGLKDKLPPEDYEQLVSAIMAFAEAAQDSEGRAGCDESAEESRAFAEGVKYGERLERDPEERKKLDREHESEGMKRAMDACGLDAENPEEARAFAEGVKYGEEKEREEPGKLAREHEREGEEKALGKDEDKDAMINKIIAAVSGLSPEQIKKMRDTLDDLAYDPATGDEELEKKVEAAQDRAFKKRGFLGAADAARIRAQAAADAMENIRAVHEAVRLVRPLVGELNPMEFASARNVYGYALDSMGKNPRNYDPRAWKGMIEIALDMQAGQNARAAAFIRESRALPTSGPFAGLSNIKFD